jgi:hypothetical protein
MRTIVVAEHFAKNPLGRFRTDGPNSGERFRDDLLIPALKSGEQVEVILDDTDGYGSSFLDESFGGLIKKRNFSREELADRLIVRAQNPLYKRYEVQAKHYLATAVPLPVNS